MHLPCREVIVADHEGPEAAFISGFQEGYAILDGMRAITNDQQLAKDSAIAMFGYSGGAHATTWAANLAPIYASELNIIGAAYGGTPVDPQRLFNFINGGFIAGFAGAGLLGLMNAYPELYDWVTARLTPDGVKTLAMERARGSCLITVSTGFAFVNFLSLVNETDPLNKPVPQKYLRRESLLRNISSVGVNVPKFPRLITHALFDEIVPYADAAQYVREQCEQGADISFNTLPIAEHVLGEIETLPVALIWLTQLYNGQQPKTTCGTGLLQLATADSPELKKIIGQDAVNQLKKLPTKASERLAAPSKAA